MTKEIDYKYSSLPSCTGSIETYINHVMAIPVLTTDEEVELGRKLQNSNDLESAKKLILHNLRYVVYIAKSYSGYGLNLNDLIQESEIHEFVIKNWKIVKVATTKTQRKLFFNLRSKKDSLASLTSEEAKSIANDLNVPIKDVMEMEKRLHNHDVAIDEKEDDDKVTPSFYLESKELQPDQLLENNEKNLLSEKLYTVLENLDERSRDIIKSRWLAETKLTLEDLSKKYEISRERVRQIETETIAKLKVSL